MGSHILHFIAEMRRNITNRAQAIFYMKWLATFFLKLQQQNRLLELVHLRISVRDHVTSSIGKTGPGAHRLKPARQLLGVFYFELDKTANETSVEVIGSSLPSAAYMHQWNGSTLVQTMACRLFGAKPLSEPTLIYSQSNF